MERQYKIVTIVIAGLFAALIVAGLYIRPMLSEAESSGTSNEVIKAKIGQTVNIRYSNAVAEMIQNLPDRNNVTVITSSELHNTDLAGLRGQLRYADMVITYVQNGDVESVTDDAFSSIEYKFRPDRGNETRYAYENAQFTGLRDDSQLVATVTPLKSAKVGEHYTVELRLETGGNVNYAIGEKTIEIVP